MPWPLNSDKKKTSVPTEHESGQASESVLTMVRHAQKNISGNV